MTLRISPSPTTTGGNNTKDAFALHQAQLADMPWETVIAFLREKGHADVASVLEMRGQGKDVQICYERVIRLPFDADEA